VLAASAAGIDGQWNAELTNRNQQAKARKRSSTLALKNQDGQVTGRVVSAGKKRTRQQAIQNAKLDRNQLTLTTLQKGKKANVTFSWQVTVDGNQMSGTRMREGAKHGLAFKARRRG
jgi:hypothetical protein